MSWKPYRFAGTGMPAALLLINRFPPTTPCPPLFWHSPLALIVLPAHRSSSVSCSPLPDLAQAPCRRPLLFCPHWPLPVLLSSSCSSPPDRAEACPGWWYPGLWRSFRCWTLPPLERRWRAGASGAWRDREKLHPSKQGRLGTSWRA